MTNYRIELSTEKKLIGKRLLMSHADYKVGELWKSFMPRRKDITNHLTNELISAVIYSPNHFVEFSLTNEFERWAAVEVADLEAVPSDMEALIIPSGLYAVFEYVGLNTNPTIFQYIFKEWLPNSCYLLDNRPHFELLGENYKNNDPTSEEEIWIPIKPSE